jgi:transposase
VSYELNVGGRPSKLNDEMIEKVKQAISKLYYIEAVADYVGISRRVVYDWLESGEKEDKEGNEENIYVRFLHAVKKSQAEAKRELVDGIKIGSGANWQSKAWILERCYPNEFGKRERIDLTANVSHSFETLLSHLDDEE